MKLDKIKEFFSEYHPGSLVRVGLKKEMASAKSRKQGISVVKMSESTVRFGVNPNNVKAIKFQKAFNAQDPAHQSRRFKPWSKRREDIPIVLEHLQDSSKQYLQIYSIANNAHPRSRYFINGEEVTKQQVIDSGYCNASEFKDNSDFTPQFIKNLEDVRFIKRKEKIYE